LAQVADIEKAKAGAMVLAAVGALFVRSASFERTRRFRFVHCESPSYVADWTHYFRKRKLDYRETMVMRGGGVMTWPRFVASITGLPD